MRNASAASLKTGAFSGASREAASRRSRVLMGAPPLPRTNTRAASEIGWTIYSARSSVSRSDPSLPRTRPRKTVRAASPERVVRQQRNQRIGLLELLVDVLVNSASSDGSPDKSRRSNSSRRANRSCSWGFWIVLRKKRFHSDRGMQGCAPSGQSGGSPSIPLALNQAATCPTTALK